MASNYYSWDKNGNIVYNEPQPQLPFMERQLRKLQALGGNLDTWLNSGNDTIEKERANFGLGLATMPIGGGVALTSNIAKPFVPLVGKKIGQSIASSIGGGLTGGAVEGFGRGLIEQENPLKTMTQDALLGGAFGGFGGYGLGRIAKEIDGYKLINHKPIKEMTKEEKTEYRKLGKNYYKNYLAETTLNKDNYGQIYFNSNSAGKNAIHNIEVYPKLKKQLKKSTVGNPTNDKNETDRYYDHLLYEQKGKNLDHQIEVIENDGKKYKMAKDIGFDSHSVPTTEANQTLSDNIITDNNTLFNPEDVSLQWKDKNISNISKSRYYPQTYRDLEYDIRLSDHNRALKGRGRWEDDAYTIQEINGIPVKIGNEIDDVYDIVLPKISDFSKVKKELVPKIKSDIATYYTNLNKEMPNLYKTLLATLGISEFSKQQEQ